MQCLYFHRFRQVLGVTPLRLLHQQAAQETLHATSLLAPTLRLLTPKERRKLLMKGGKRCRHSFKLSYIHHKPGIPPP